MTGKPHIEFRQLSDAEGWAPAPGYPPTIVAEERILASDFDEAAGRGSYTRLLRFAPGGRTDEPVAHDYWEEVYLLEGDLTVGTDPAGRETFHAPTYACRPPGAVHGPFATTNGCTMLELRYFTAATGSIA